MGHRLEWHLAPVTLAFLATAWPGGAAAGLAARLEPSYDAVDTTATDQSGTTSRTSSSAFTQRYYLALDEALFPNLRLGGTGLYQWVLGSSTAADGRASESDARLWNADVRLTAGDQILRGVASYTLNEQSGRSLTDGLGASAPTLVHDNVGLSGFWRPDRLPELQLSFNRDTQHDRDRKTADLTSYQLLVQSVYRPDRRIDLRARLVYADQDDHLHRADTRSLGEQLRISFADDYYDRRIALYLTYVVDGNQRETTVTGQGGAVFVQQYPFAGLSTVEGITVTPVRDALSSNPALIDGDTTVGAGVNIGFGPSVSGDTAYRDLGAQFVNTITPVDVVYVWVTKPLPVAVASAFSWAAYQSDDNRNWTPVQPAGPVVFGLFQNRFEIPIASTQARYLKVVTKPLAVGVTTDTLYNDILVTELQFFQSLTAGAARHVDSVSGLLSASSRVQIIRSHLFYDVSLSLQHVDNPARAIWNVTNGLSLAQPLGRVLNLSARADRTDGNDPRYGHTAATRWAAALDATPLPALSSTLSYNGDLTQSGSSRTLNNNLGLFGRATPYEGISLFGSLGHAWGARPSGQDQRSEMATAGVSLTPNPKLSLNGGFTWSLTFLSGGGLPESRTEIWRLDGSVSLSPVPAFYATLGASRGVIAGVGQTLVNVSGNLSPFPGGNLLLTFRYNEAHDSLSESKSRILGPYLRWTIRAGTFVEASYTWLYSSSPIQETSSRSFNTRLTLVL